MPRLLYTSATHDDYHVDPNDTLPARSKDLVADWLAKYMFRADADHVNKGKQIAEWLGEHGNFKTHGRRVKLEDPQPRGLDIKNLRDDPELYRRVWELHCALDITLTNTAIYKIFYNSAGVGMVKQQAQAIQLMTVHPGQPGAPAAPPVLTSPQQPLNRAARRRMQKGH